MNCDRSLSRDYQQKSPWKPRAISVETIEDLEDGTQDADAGLAQRGMAAIVGSSEIRVQFALDRAVVVPHLIEWHPNVGIGTPQHRLLTVLDRLLMTHDELTRLSGGVHLRSLQQAQ